MLELKTLEVLGETMADWHDVLWILCLTYLIPKVQHKIVFSTLNKTLKLCSPVLSSLLSFSRCFAALGDVSTVRFLRQTNQIADKVSQETVWFMSGQVQDAADTCAGLKVALIFSDIWFKKSTGLEHRLIKVSSAIHFCWTWVMALQFAGEESKIPFSLTCRRNSGKSFSFKHNVPVLLAPRPNLVLSN